MGRVVIRAHRQGKAILIILNNNPAAQTVTITMAGFGREGAAMSDLTSVEGAYWQASSDIQFNAASTTMTLPSLNISTLLER